MRQTEDASDVPLYPASKRPTAAWRIRAAPMAAGGRDVWLRQTGIFGKGIAITPLCREGAKPRPLHPYRALCALERSESNQHKAQPPTARKGGGFTSFSLLTRPRSGAVAVDACSFKEEGFGVPLHLETKRLHGQARGLATPNKRV